jgi:hypothetical protein
VTAPHITIAEDGRSATGTFYLHCLSRVRRKQDRPSGGRKHYAYTPLRGTGHYGEGSRRVEHRRGADDEHPALLSPHAVRNGRRAARRAAHQGASRAPHRGLAAADRPRAVTPDSQAARRPPDGRRQATSRVKRAGSVRFHPREQE